jgi:hypothetical protein
MHICEYGCGKEATHQFISSKKWCCTNNVNSCEGKKEKDRIKKKGKLPKWKDSMHPKGMLGKEPVNKNKTLEEQHGVEKAKIIKEKMSKALIGHAWITDSEKLKNFKLKASERAYKRHANGWQGAIGRCKKIKYISHIAGEVILDGGWELIVAKYFDKLNIKWTKNKKRFKYIFENKDRFYTPDFYLFDSDMYIEVKGYETNLDKAKWEQFPEKLEVWKKEKIKEIKYSME